MKIFVDGTAGSRCLSFSGLPDSPSGAFQQKLALGQTLSGRIISWLKPNIAEIELNGRTLLARSDISLQPGQEITVQVKQLLPEVQLSLIIKGQDEVMAQKSLSLVRAYLPQRTSLGEAISNLQSVLQNMAPLLKNTPYFSGILRLQSLISSLIFYPEDLGHHLLGQIVKKLGLNREAVLKRQLGKPGVTKAKGMNNSANLKGLILEMLYELKRADHEGGWKFGSAGTGLEAILEALEDAGRQIELNQLLNVITWKEQGNFFIQIPLAGDGVINTALIVFQYEQEKKDKGEGAADFHSLSIYLHMQQLGELKIEVNIKGNNLSCTIFTHDNAISEFITLHLPELEKKLLNLGFHILGLKSHSACTKLSQESVIGNIFKNSYLLDLRV